MQESIISWTSPLGGTVSAQIANALVFDHCVFAVSKRFVIASEATVWVIIDPTTGGGYTKKQLVVSPVTFEAYEAGTIDIDLHAGVTYEDGTEWEAIDRNNVDSQIPQTKIIFNPTLLTPGLKLSPEWSIYSDGVAAVATIGSRAGDDLIFNANPKLVYAFKLTNNDAANAAKCTTKMNFLELC